MIRRRPGIECRLLNLRGKYMWPYPTVAAHRGGGTLAPENTLAALRCGLEYGFRAVEFDVMLTRDAQPILMHDATFGRTLSGEGQIAQHTLAQLQTRDAGVWHSARYAGEPICTLQQALQFCHDNAIWMNIEIKPSSPELAARTGEVTGAAVAQFLAAMPGAGVHRLPLFSSFSADALMAARRVAPDIARGFLCDRIEPDWPDRLHTLGAMALHTNHRHLTLPLAQSVKQAGYGLFCYTVNDPARAREIMEWGVDAFCTDRIDLFQPDPA